MSDYQKLEDVLILDMYTIIYSTDGQGLWEGEPKDCPLSKYTKVNGHCVTHTAWRDINNIFITKGDYYGNNAEKKNN